MVGRSYQHRNEYRRCKSDDNYYVYSDRYSKWLFKYRFGNGDSYSIAYDFSYIAHHLRRSNGKLICFWRNKLQLECRSNVDRNKHCRCQSYKHHYVYGDRNQFRMLQYRSIHCNRKPLAGCNNSKCYTSMLWCIAFQLICCHFRRNLVWNRYYKYKCGNL